ncbi:IS66 family transposase [Singulisphaera sp. Ch08]|uniref:IS66 family transposase n=2 Tax=Singulisphaera sp. Ch08 TaxID=3120278 RepID=A0AAU7C9G2_9BACT
MTNPLPIPDDLWSTVPPDAQAAIAAVFVAMQQRHADLEARVSDLEARLKLNSTNSSKPPSSDPIGLKRRPPAPASGKKRGGQPGHRKSHRALVPPEKLRQTIHCKPEACRRCGQGLRGDDPEPLIHQVAELPKIEPLVDEYRLHRLTCPGCGETTCGALPPGVPSGCFGPYLQAVLAMLAGAYRLSKRQIQQVSSDLFTLSISTGMIAKLERQSAAALEAPYNELALSVHQAEVANIDETSWREQLRKVWLWVTVTRLTTVFTIAKNRSGAIARALLGSQDGQVVTSDRFSAYDWIMASWRQICWAHLRRDFQAMIDRGGGSERVGQRLLGLSNRLFRHWHRVRDGTVPWDQFQERMSRLRREVKRALQEGSRSSCAKTAATCFEILKVEEGLWTFARVRGVEPTNNVAERSLRHAVIWRRISGGTASAEGSRFVERMLTVVATSRQQGRNVLDYLTSCFEADRRGHAVPSLLPASTSDIKAA